MSSVAIATSRHADAEWLLRAAHGALDVVDSAAAADVIVTDEDCLPSILPHLATDAPIVVLGDPAAPPAHASHVITQAWPDEQVRTLLLAIARGAPDPELALAGPRTADEARSAQQVLAAARKLLGVTDLAAFETTIVEILIELVQCDRAYCLFHDHGDGALWSQVGHTSAEGDDRRAVHGLAGFAARTGVLAVAAKAGEDPRFIGAVDDPHGDPSDHLIAQPVYGGDGAVHAVLVCARSARRAGFGAHDIALLGRFARLVTPVLDHLAIDVQAQAILDEVDGRNGLFRGEAIASRERKPWGEVVRVSPRFVSWAYWLLVVLLVASAVFVSVGKVSTYSTGPAIIRSNARTPVTARSAGNVATVEVSPGDRVAAGAVIARLDDSNERATVVRLERELDTQLRNHMLDLTDAGASAAVRSIRNELEAARVSLSERQIVTARGGLVGDIRVRPGQHVEPGDFVAGVLDDSQGLEVLALLPGADRPLLAPGMTLRLELAGYRYAYRSITIEHVASDVIAPREARRVLGAEVADGIEIPGPVVIVRGRLSSPDFVVDGRVFRYHDGMLGTAEVRVRSEPIVFALVPGTRRLQ